MSDQERCPTGWVSVSERLPESGVEVLVYTSFGTIELDRYGDSSAGGETWQEWDVRYWMPLPSAPSSVAEQPQIGPNTIRTPDGGLATLGIAGGEYKAEQPQPMIADPHNPLAAERTRREAAERELKELREAMHKIRKVSPNATEMFGIACDALHTYSSSEMCPICPMGMIEGCARDRAALRGKEGE